MQFDHAIAAPHDVRERTSESAAAGINPLTRGASMTRPVERAPGAHVRHRVQPGWMSPWLTSTRSALRNASASVAWAPR